MNWLEGFSLDLKLGGRMLVKYPGLTIVGGLAMAFAIWVGTVIFEVLTLLVHPTLPLPAGDRIVQIRNWDVAANQSRAARAARLHRLARRAAVRDRARRLAGRHPQPDRRRRRRASRRGRGDHRLRLSHRRGCAAPGPRPRGRRRAGRCATGGRARVRRVANALRRATPMWSAAPCSSATSTRRWSA